MPSFHKSALTSILCIRKVFTADQPPPVVLLSTQSAPSSKKKNLQIHTTHVTIQMTATSQAHHCHSVLCLLGSCSAGHRWSAPRAGSLRRCSSPMLHPGELLPPVGEVAEGVRAGEVRGGGSHLQREHVVHHLTQTYITEERRGEEEETTSRR